MPGIFGNVRIRHLQPVSYFGASGAAGTGCSRPAVPGARIPRGRRVDPGAASDRSWWAGPVRQAA